MKYYLTTPIYYVNDSPHIGHAYTTIAADVLSRFKRLCGDDVYFLTGTDEHGAKICAAALSAGVEPAQFCDRISQEFRRAWKSLSVTNDYFVRTTDERHEKAVAKFLLKLYESGAVKKGKYEGLYCVGCEKFLAEDDLVDGCCPDHKQKPKIHSEENWFFQLSDYQQKLIDIISDPNTGSLRILPAERRNEILGKLRANKLENVSISRSALDWGIRLPFDKTQTAYVWVDALLNYVTAIGYGDDEKAFAGYWPCDLHLMAKDILWFHTVIWPAMLMAAGLPLPKTVFAHGFFTIDGQKMSKTLGNVIKPQDLIDKFGVDASRYLVLSLFPFGSDGDISWQALTDKYNTDLANNLGNLVSRTLTMVEKYFGGTIPERKPSDAFLSVTGPLLDIRILYKDLAFSEILSNIQKAVDLANRHIESTSPWKMAKENNPELSDVLHDLIHAIGHIAFQILPFMPALAQSVWECIGETGRIEESALGYFSRKMVYAPKTGQKVKKPAALFPRIQG
ncbi:MAG: methionine--tRNA ligase [Endomicrobiales bacterium]|nr:methionine--tRNA ligase [Endomicrobiales bacterium]